MTSGVPQRSILEPMSFRTFVDNMDSGIEYNLIRFADDTKLRGADNMLEGMEVQRDLNSLERWTFANLVKFNRVKYKVLNWAVAIPAHSHVWWKVTEGSPAEPDLGLMVDQKFTASQQCELTAQKDN